MANEDLITQAHQQGQTARAALIEKRASDEFYDKFATDVTGVWLGYEGSLGKVRYKGKEYLAHVLAATGIAYGRKVNLRRTKNRNFVTW